MDRYVAEVIYKAAKITQTIQLPSGDIVDGLDRTALPAILDSLPPLPEALELPPGVELGLTTSSGLGWSPRTAFA